MSLSKAQPSCLSRAQGAGCPCETRMSAESDGLERTDQTELDGQETHNEL
jgi:hypothetical protein